MEETTTVQLDKEELAELYRHHLSTYISWCWKCCVTQVYGEVGLARHHQTRAEYFKAMLPKETADGVYEDIANDWKKEIGEEDWELLANGEQEERFAKLSQKYCPR